METLQNEEEVALVFGAEIDDSSGVKRQAGREARNLNLDQIHPITANSNQS